MKVKAMLTIQNAPARLDRYTVVRRGEDGQLWYWGTYDDKNRAEMAAAELGNGLVIEVNEYHGGTGV